MNRRNFVKKSVLGGMTFFEIPLTSKKTHRKNDQPYELSLDSPIRYFDGENCFVHPRAGIVPGVGKGGLPRVVMTMTTQDLSGSDVFRTASRMQTDNLGKSWTHPTDSASLADRHEIIDGERRPVALSDFCPDWHRHSKTLLGTGHTVAYTPEWEVTNPRPRHTSYSFYKPCDGTWSEWQKLEMPDDKKFHNCGAGSVQRYDKADGTILLPVY